MKFKFKHIIYYVCIASALYFGSIIILASIEYIYKAKLTAKVDKIIPHDFYYTKYNVQSIDSVLNNQHKIFERITVDKPKSYDLVGKPPEYNYRYYLNVSDESDAPWIIFKLEKKKGNIYISELVPISIYSPDSLNEKEIFNILDSSYNITSQKLKGESATFRKMISLAESCINSIDHDSYISYNENIYEYQYGVHYDYEYEITMGTTLDQSYTDYKNFRVEYEEFPVKLLYLGSNPKYDEPKQQIFENIGIFLLYVLQIWIISYIIDWLRYKLFDRKKTLHYKLLKITDPINFSNPYDEDKVKLAINFQNRIRCINEDDIAALTTIRQEIENRLNISTILSSDLENLKKFCDPRRYIKSNSIEKIELASKLYAILNKKNLTFEEFENVKIKAERLKF